MKRASCGLIFSFIAIIAIALVGPVSIASTIDAQARLDSVTVYHGSAETVRNATLMLPAGATTVVFRDVPASTRAESLRVRPIVGDARIGMVELRRRLDEPDDKRVAELDTLIEAHEDAIAAVTKSRELDSALRAYLEGVLRSSATLQGSKVLDGGGEPETILAVYELARRELTALVEADLIRRPRLRELEAELARDRARLDELAQDGYAEHHDVRVELELDRAGSVELELISEVVGASWLPSYRAELDGEGGRVRLVTEAVVEQSTGEDWSDVRLQLSSAAPSRRLTEPRLGSTWLAVQADGPAAGELTERWASRVNPNSIEEMQVITAGAGVEFGRAQGGFATIVSAPGPAGYSVTFGVPGAASVPSDGTKRRVMLRADELDATPTYRAVPAQEPRAYLVVNATSPSGYPLLAGPLRVYVDNAYLGSARLPETGPGAKLTIPFGVDNRIELTHVPSRLDGDGGWGGKRRVLTRSARTMIRNLHTRPVTLIVEDRVPVARDNRIEVRLTSGTTPGHTPSKHRAGVLLWELELAPGEERELVLDYDVQHPAELTLRTAN